MENKIEKEKQIKPMVIDQLFEIEKSQDKKISVRLLEFHGYRYVDVRNAGMEQGNWKFGNGITLNKKTFPVFLSSLNAYEETISLALNAQAPEV